jgi:hypothetical protein
MASLITKPLFYYSLDLPDPYGAFSSEMNYRLFLLGPVYGACI